MKISQRNLLSQKEFFARPSRFTRAILLVLMMVLVLPGFSGLDAQRLEPSLEKAKNEKDLKHCSNVQLTKVLQAIYQQNPQLRENAANARQRIELDGLNRLTKGVDNVNAVQTYTIPIVFHVVHAGGVENVPASKIDEAMEMLENDFRALNSDTSEVVASFQDRIADLQIEFKLAQIDPDGYPTSGITRDLSNYTYNGLWDWPQVKEANYWPRDKYINVWVCLSSNGSNGSAWAYLPSQVDNGSGYEHLDGVVMSSWCLGYTTAGYHRILTHEIGHVLNLRHTWGPGEFQGTNACSEDDYIADTPNCHGYYGACDTTYTSCGSLDNIQNFMDYAQCPVMFTEGQKTRALDALTSSVADRNNLYSSANLAATLFPTATPRIVYSHGMHANNLFEEDDANDGSIASTLIINLVDTGAGEKFAVTSGGMTRNSHYTATNVPAGLTPVMTATSATSATLTLSGTANNHADTNDVSNLTITFLNAAFSGGNANALHNPSDNHIRVNYNDPYAIVHNDIADITCDSTTTWTYFRTESDAPFSSDFGTWLHDGNMFKLETYSKSLVCNSGTRNITPLAADTLIDANSNWQEPGSYPYQLDVSNPTYTSWNGQTAYVGFQIQLLGKTHYGWMKLQVNAGGTTMTLLEHAYNPQPGGAINAGSTQMPGGGNPVINAGFTFSTSNLTVNFTDTSTAANTTVSNWSWDFGDGNSSNQQNPSHTYTSAGTYTVTLTASDNGSTSDTATQSVTVSTAPPSVTAGFTYGTSGLTANFTDSSTAQNTTINSWQWNFGDGNSSTQQNPSHSYASSGTYSVSLTVGDGSVSDNTSQSVTVSGSISYCAATHIYDYGYISNVTVGSINNTSTWGSSGYADFTSQSTTMNTGTGYNITVTCQNQHWPLNSMGIWADWNQDGDFEDSGETILTTTGAGPYSTTITPPGTAAAGSTRLRVRMMYDKTPVSCGADLYFGDVEDYTITIGGGSANPPVAAFTASPTSILSGQSVTFTDQSSNGPTAWSWTFTGGTPASSSTQNPVVTYSTAGTYTVSLIAGNSAGNDTETKTSYITVTDQAITYCPSSASNSSYEWIAGVQVGPLNNTSGAAGYTDYTNLTANLSAGAAVNVNLTPGFSSSSYSEYWKIWIDYNADGDFDDAGEEVYNGSGTTALSGNFTVPAGAAGTTRMRVSMRYNRTANPCDSFTYGEVEDYTVSIQ